MRPALAALALVLAACAEAPPDPSVLTVRAEFVQSMYGGEAVLVRHEAVPGRMPAMRMALLVPDPAVLGDLGPGDAVVLSLDSLTLAVVGAARLPRGTALDLADDSAEVEFSPDAVTR